MCNINALFVKKKKASLTAFLMAVSSHSYASNDDGEGIYVSSSDKVYKSKDKMNLFEHEQEIEDSKVIISHQRLSTSGFELEFNHPFENDDFVLVHNGVINQFKEKEGSDTWGFWNKFNKEFNVITAHISREEKIKKVICDLFKVNSGSYSILIYDKKMKQSWYFRGSSYPNINFYENDEYLFVTTNSENAIFLKMLTNKKFNELDIKERVIYRLSENGTVYKSKDMPKEVFKIRHESRHVEVFGDDKPTMETGFYCDECDKICKGQMHVEDSANLCSNCYRKAKGFSEDKS